MESSFINKLWRTVSFNRQRRRWREFEASIVKTSRCLGILKLQQPPLDVMMPMTIILSFCDRLAAIVECLSILYITIAFATFSVDRSRTKIEVESLDTIDTTLATKQTITTPTETIATAEIAPDRNSTATQKTSSLKPKNTKWRSDQTEQLRQQCKSLGIRWRNAHGNGKHLTVAEMQWQLTLVALF